MSETPQGAGWWLASDGRWYPPQPPPFNGTATPSPQPGGSGGPGGPAGPPPGRVWWRHPATIVASLVLCFPVGLVLLWQAPWTNRTKGIISVVVLAVVAYAGWSGDDQGSEQVAAAEDEQVDVRDTTTTTEFERTTTSTTTTTMPPTTRPPDLAVEEVVDGDTIRVEGGRKVRLIGIDAPETGAHGFAEAKDLLLSLIVGKRVVLVPGARDDLDRYGRLLRYVDVDGVDLNLELLKSGWVRARYDSRDGYGRHAREDAYVAADAAAPDLYVRPAPTTTPPPPPTEPPRQFAPSPPPTTAAPPPPSGGGTDPRFGTCKEAIANGFGNYRRGVDPEYGWYRDADSDGIVCES